MQSFFFLEIVIISIVVAANASVPNANIICKEEDCSSSLCCYFEEIFGVGGSAYNFQATIHPSYIRKIRFINSSFSEIPPGIFTYFTNLAELDLRNTLLKSTNDYSFNGARQLNTLYLSYNHLEKLSNMMFYGAFGLGYLDLSHNSIFEVEELTFYGLKTLNTLDLSFNRIKTLPAKCFNSLEALYTLNLSHNVLDDLHEEIFIDNLFLTKVDLRKNSLTVLDKKLFRYNKNIRILNVADNNLEDVTFINHMDLSRIEDLNLSKNALFHLNTTAFEFMKNLRKLNISYTGTTNIEKFNFHELKNVFSLDFSGNNIKNFFFNSSSILNNLTQLFCNKCRLTTIDYETLIKAFPNLKYISLSKNQWNCKYFNQLTQNFKNHGVEVVDDEHCVTVDNVTDKIGISCLDEVALARIQTNKKTERRLRDVRNLLKEELRIYLVKKSAELTEDIIEKTQYFFNTV